jgi:hypothetical protein
MRRKVFRMRRWLALSAVVSVLALVMASGAQALRPADDVGLVSTKSAPVATTGNGFNWGDAAIGVGVGLGIALSGAGLVQLGRNRRRLATLL